MVFVSINTGYGDSYFVNNSRQFEYMYMYCVKSSTTNNHDGERKVRTIRFSEISKKNATTRGNIKNRMLKPGAQENTQNIS